MARNLRLFDTVSNYQSADLVIPSVSYVVENDTVYYDAIEPPFRGKWKATYQDSHIESAQCDASSATTQNEITTTNLVSVEIGGCVTTIGKNSFLFSKKLTGITISDGVTTIAEDTFYGCSALTSINIPDSVTSIGSNAFYNCNSLPVENNIRYADTCSVGAVDKTLSTYNLKDETKFIGNDAFIA